MPMTFAPTLSWELVVALAALLVLAVVASRVGHVGIDRDVVVATVRAVVQLAIVALIIGVVLRRSWASVLFAIVMFSVAVGTASGRVTARTAWPWIAVALASGVVPVLTIIFALQAAAGWSAARPSAW